MIGFAEKKGVIDLKFLFDVYKQRIEAIESHPLFNKWEEVQIYFNLIFIRILYTIEVV